MTSVTRIKAALHAGRGSKTVGLPFISIATHTKASIYAGHEKCDLSKVLLPIILFITNRLLTLTRTYHKMTLCAVSLILWPCFPLIPAVSLPLDDPGGAASHLVANKWVGLYML